MISKEDWDFVSKDIPDSEFNKRFIILSRKYVASINPNLIQSLKKREKYYWAKKFIMPADINDLNEKDKWCLALISKVRPSDDEAGKYEVFYGMLNFLRNGF